MSDAHHERAFDDFQPTITAHDTAEGVVYEPAAWTIRATPEMTVRAAPEGNHQ